MSGRGETGQSSVGQERAEIALGQQLYTEDGEEVGIVRGIEERGIFVTDRGGVESLSVEHARSGHAFGEAELVWRCMTCGEMGEIADQLPGTCPGCGSPREELMYWTED